MTRRPTTAARTEPKEKKMERAVTRCCFDFGICSNRRVPSVGIEPYIEKKEDQEGRKEEEVDVHQLHCPGRIAGCLGLRMSWQMKRERRKWQ